MSKQLVLTNWQVPRDPKMAGFDAMREAPAIDMKNYENVGGVEQHDSVDSVAAKMIAKQEAARGVKIDQEEKPAATLSMNGVKDDRPNRKFWKPGDPV